MEIYLVRHIEPDVEKGICYGQMDVPIPRDYYRSHKQIIDRLPKKYDSVYSSPLTRCKLLAEQMSGDVIFDDRLKELNFGDWEGKNWHEINQAELDHWMKNYIQEGPQNGESLNDLVERFRAFCQDLKMNDHTIAIVITHAGIIRASKHIFNSIDIGRVMMESVPFGSISHVAI